MKIVATSDTHRVPALSIPDGDVFVHAGDLMQTGYPSEWSDRVEWLASLPHRIKIYVPGNHDFHMQVYPGPALQDMRRAGVTVIGLPGNDHFMSYKLPNGMSLLGLPYVTNLPRWAFNTTEWELGARLDAIWNLASPHDIIVSHTPVKGILDFSNHKQEHAGISMYLQHFHANVSRGTPPKVWISGHIHEGYGKVERDGCTFYNVAMCDREYMHRNLPVEIFV
jgi:Icc-related predicted phosphoesterase